MKILSIGSFPDYQIQLTNALSKTHETMLIIYTVNNPVLLDNINLLNKNTIFINLLRTGSISNIWATYEFCLNMRNVLTHIHTFNPDIIHFQIGSPILALLLPFLKKYPIVCTFHDVVPHLGEDAIGVRIGLYLLRKYSNAIIVHGNYLKKQMINFYNIESEKIFVIPIGPHNIEPFKQYDDPNIQEEKNIILFFGRIQDYKGLEFLIRAEPIITHECPGTKIIIAGDGKNFDKYYKQIVNFDNFIIINKYIDYREGAKLLQKSSIIVLPYIDASQSGVILTAYGYKKAIVATKVGSIPEIIDDGITGLLIPPRDYHSLAEAIIKLLKNDSLKVEIGKNGYKKLQTDLSWDNISYETLNVYTYIINKNKNP